MDVCACGYYCSAPSSGAQNAMYDVWCAYSHTLSRDDEANESVRSTSSETTAAGGHTSHASTLKTQNFRSAIAKWEKSAQPSERVRLGYTRLGRLLRQTRLYDMLLYCTGGTGTECRARAL